LVSTGSSQQKHHHQVVAQPDKKKMAKPLTQLQAQQNWQRDTPLLQPPVDNQDFLHATHLTERERNEVTRLLFSLPKAAYEPAVDICCVLITTLCGAQAC
jgi:hypothetical protein